MKFPKFRINDYVSVDQCEGEVFKVNFIQTKIRQIKDEHGHKKNVVTFAYGLLYQGHTVYEFLEPEQALFTEEELTLKERSL